MSEKTATTAVVLLSGGQDSTTCLYWARARFDRLIALSFDYGQRHRTELDAAREIAARAGVVEHVVLDVPALSQLGNGALVNGDAITAHGGLVDAEMPEGLPTSYVPGRNALFLAFAASLAVARNARDIVTGVCEADYSGYPDCREGFIRATERSLTLAMPSSCGPLRVHTPLMALTKNEIVRLSRELDGCWDALALSVTCYEGQRPGCGACPACVLRANGFAAVGLVDPATQPAG